MATIEVNYDPADAITVGVEGEPGNRTFFLEARQGTATCTVILEKAQLRELGAQILSILEPEEGHSGFAPDPVTSPASPPGWRVGSIQLSLDEPGGRCTLLLEEMPTVALAEDRDEEGSGEPEDLRAVRLVASVRQIRRLGESAVRVVGGGRPLCPLCHFPIDPDGHVCPATNGHHPV
jgi:uncharacterized repeat protein (TIGR03847 family)